ncbi:MAG: DUF86 domain-containing protein [Phycisphaeraceae bacterium]|nr:DUF86 domain-containing protein [Phycisphaeraceae bacterium]
MRPEERDAALLLDMVEHARRACGYVDGRTLEQYRRDDMLRDAVNRVVQVIGEAAAKVSKQFRDAHPEIPWRPIIAQRHILVHEYGHIDDDKIWRVATLYAPQLIALVEPLLPPPPADPLPE